MSEPLDPPPSPALACARLLVAGVEIALALGHSDEAERFCARLEATAAEFGTAGFRAWAGQARAAMLIAQAQYASALPVLEFVVRDYRSLHARHDTARAYEMLAQAHSGLGQSSVAAADSATALAIYRELGASSSLMLGRVAANSSGRERCNRHGNVHSGLPWRPVRHML